MHLEVPLLLCNPYIFQVLIWEVGTNGGRPWPNESTTEVIQRVLHERKMMQKSICHDNLYEIAKICWEFDPSARPSFETLLQKLLALEQKKPDLLPTPSDPSLNSHAYQYPPALKEKKSNESYVAM